MFQLLNSDLYQCTNISIKFIYEKFHFDHPRFYAVCSLFIPNEFALLTKSHFSDEVFQIGDIGTGPGKCFKIEGVFW